MRKIIQVSQISSQNGNMAVQVYHGHRLLELCFCFLLEKFYKSTMLIFAQNLRTIPASTKDQRLKFFM